MLPLIENNFVVERGVDPKEVQVEDIDGGGRGHDEAERQSEERESEVNEEETSEEDVSGLREPVVFTGAC
jgi:hypothetical protein